MLQGVIRNDDFSADRAGCKCVCWSLLQNLQPKNCTEDRFLRKFFRGCKFSWATCVRKFATPKCMNAVLRINWSLRIVPSHLNSQHLSWLNKIWILFCSPEITQCSQITYKNVSGRRIISSKNDYVLEKFPPTFSRESMWQELFLIFNNFSCYCYKKELNMLQALPKAFDSVSLWLYDIDNILEIAFQWLEYNSFYTRLEDAFSLTTLVMLSITITRTHN